MRRRILGLLLFQAAWLACALSGAQGSWLPAALVALPVIAWNVAVSGAPARALGLTLGAVLVGPLADAGLVAADLVALSPAPWRGVVMPAWWLLLWGAFASSLPVGFGWLAGRTRLATVLGALCGPLSYWAGLRLGAIGFPSGAAAGLAGVALAWGLLFPLLVVVAGRLLPGFAPSAGAPLREGSP